MEVHNRRKRDVLQPLPLLNCDNYQISRKRKASHPPKKNKISGGARRAKHDKQMTVPATIENVENMLCSDKVPDSYWQTVAQETKTALSKTLEENEELHKLTDQLKEENVSLKSLVEYYSLMYHTCIATTYQTAP
ncbi:uncharacterized protein TRIADDRAFT_58228 [Trichoplax adhaerens]|uniref:Geminin n=1 Tax=Trichoplax adhaerens TaxID=10228 RepID=B3S178_TRIAD|nr:predicted protein [Trichoplax adhaerens]EDV23514.1 predicted protein [Trichoplax adhaerens]|eukprot:XP_002114424.1 predicted protein [Trichoplax adhaerens]